MVNGQPEDISIVRANFEALATIVNALDDSNIAPNANIQLSKLAGGGGAFGGVNFAGGAISAPGTVTSGTGFIANNTDVSKPAFSDLIQGELFPRMYIGGDGSLHLGPGNAAADANIYRTTYSPGLPALQTDVQFRSLNDILAGVDDLNTAVRIGQLYPGGYAGIRFGETFNITKQGNNLVSDATFQAPVFAGKVGADVPWANTITIDSTYHRLVGAGPGPTRTILGATAPGQILYLFWGGAGGTQVLSNGGNIAFPASGDLNKGVFGTQEFRTLMWDGGQWVIARG